MFCVLRLCLSFDCFVVFVEFVETNWGLWLWFFFLVVLNMSMKMDLNGPNEHVKLVVLWICTLCPTFGIFLFHMWTWKFSFYCTLVNRRKIEILKQIEVYDLDFFSDFEHGQENGPNGPNEYVKFLVVLWILTLCTTFGIFVFHMWTWKFCCYCTLLNRRKNWIHIIWPSVWIKQPWRWWLSD